MADTKLQATIEKKLSDLLNGKGPQDKETRDQDLEAIGLAIKWVAVKHKVDPGDWGKDLEDGDDDK